MNRTIKIGKPYTPCRVVNRTVVNVTSLMLSCGGGVGGSCWSEYTSDSFDLNNRFININTNISNNENINTNNIVKTQPVKLVILEVENLGNNCMGDVGETRTYVYEVSCGTEVEFVDYFQRDQVELVTVHNFDFIQQLESGTGVA